MQCVVVIGRSRNYQCVINAGREHFEISPEFELRQWCLVGERQIDDGSLHSRRPLDYVRSSSCGMSTPYVLATEIGNGLFLVFWVWALLLCDP